MDRTWPWLVALALVGCRAGGPQGPDGSGGSGGSGATHGDETSSGGAADETAGTEGPSPEGAHFDLPALAEVLDDHFATSLVCAQCHSNANGAVAMRDEADRDIAPYDLWQATMMANSARDPFWWAMVKAETVAMPSRAAEIEAECTKCHAPMASIREDLYDGPLALADLLDGDADRAQLGLDGVACAACHQIPADAGQGPPPLTANGQIFGPHVAPFTMPMQMRTGMTPTYAAHMDASATCGTCHTLRTEPHSPEGTPVGGHFTEQAPYLEWRNSVYSTEGVAPGPEAASCQRCHMPSRSEDGAAISTRIARRPMGDDFPPIGERSPYHRHVMVGGNTLVPAMIRDFADELRPPASEAAFDAVIEAATAMLQDDTATVTVPDAHREGDTLVLAVHVESLAGHKLPTGIPSRRAFLRVTVRDAAGAVVFRSGGTDAQGQLVDGEGTVLAIETLDGGIEPHHQQITDDAQVQIYEAVMQDADGAATYRLLRASAYAKDNRLLPRGWSPTGPDAAETTPVLGGTDADFQGGGDALEVRVSAVAASGPHEVEVALLYQPIGARFAAELLALEAPEIRAFERMWDASDRSPVPMAVTTVVVP